ncbi:IS982 family transposase, partial [Meiothermus rufus]|uniref:IS982 family transposase n=1 Tax=Meiothermus rufus TaxID=604332 RepID=UPI0004839001
MLNQAIAAFCIIDDLLTLMGHNDDPQTKTPSSAILTLGTLAALACGGNHAKALNLAQDLRLFTHIPSKSRFNRRLRRLRPYLLPLLSLLRRLWPSLHQAQQYALDTFPIPTCENIRAPRSRLAPGLVYRGYIPSRRVYFHGFKLHLLVDKGLFIHELVLTPGSLADLKGLLLLPLNLGPGTLVAVDRGYGSYLLEDLLLEAEGIRLLPVRKENSKRFHLWYPYLAITQRRVVETVGSMLHALFPRRIHATTQEGFLIKVILFVLAHNLRFME